MRLAQEQFGKAYKQTLGLDFFLKRLTLPGKVLKAVYHVSDWPRQSQVNTTEFFVRFMYVKEGKSS